MHERSSSAGWAQLAGTLAALALSAAALSCGGSQAPSRGDDLGGSARGGQSAGTGSLGWGSRPAGSGAGTGTGTAGAGFGDSGGITLPDAGQNTGSNKPQVCARSDVVAGRVTPTVILIIDQSSSMHDSIGSGTRWNVLRDFLLKSDGLIKSLQDKMRFGIAMYSARSDMQANCPMVTQVAPALGNFAAIETAYRAAEPIEDTPTGDAIDSVVASLPKPAPDAPRDPVIFVLATDGEPDRCEELDPQNGQAEAIDAVTRAYGMNIETFVIGVGNELSMKHAQDVANAGVGVKPGEPNAPYWTAMDDASLKTALTDIISAQVSCDVQLKGRVDGDPCTGKVRLSGKDLVCKDPNGWELADPTHVRLLGESCKSFQKEEVSTLFIEFPCEVIRPE
jgi:von Willebrand factor type A domain